MYSLILISMKLSMGVRNVGEEQLLPPESTITSEQNVHCVKSVRIRSYSGPHFPVFRLNTKRYGVSLRIQSKCGKNADQNNSEFEHFLHCGNNQKKFCLNIKIGVLSCNASVLFAEAAYRGVLQKKFTEKKICAEVVFLLMKLQDQGSNFIKKETSNRCFPVKFSNF